MTDLIDRIRERMEGLRQGHLVVDDDGWYSCPKSGTCIRNEPEDYCDCGADRHNAALDAITDTLLALVEENADARVCIELQGGPMQMFPCQSCGKEWPWPGVLSTGMGKCPPCLRGEMRHLRALVEKAGEMEKALRDEIIVEFRRIAGYACKLAEQAEKAGAKGLGAHDAWFRSHAEEGERKALAALAAFKAVKETT